MDGTDKESSKPQFVRRERNGKIVENYFVVDKPDIVKPQPVSRSEAAALLSSRKAAVVPDSTPKPTVPPPWPEPRRPRTPWRHTTPRHQVIPDYRIGFPQSEPQPCCSKDLPRFPFPKPEPQPGCSRTLIPHVASNKPRPNKSVHRAVEFPKPESQPCCSKDIPRATTDSLPQPRRNKSVPRPAFFKAEPKPAGFSPSSTLVAPGSVNTRRHGNLPKGFVFDEEIGPECGKLCVNQTHECNAPPHGNSPCPPCTVKVISNYDCGHYQILPCHLINNPDVDRCENYTMIESPCGHFVEFPCHLGKATPSKLLKLCDVPCKHKFETNDGGCGHDCTGNCSQCIQGKFHTECAQLCGKRLLCGHFCFHKCAEICPPCLAKCETVCPHGRCNKVFCGVPCDPCMEQCTWSCPHHECTKKCGEICDREPCDLPCPLVFEKCGHSCLGYCGEPCPKLCGICDKEELLKPHAEILGIDDFDPNDKFIYLPECKHTIEVGLLEQWLNATPANNEILPKECPICKTRIFQVPRFQEIIKTNMNEVNKIKALILGKTEELRTKYSEATEILHNKQQHMGKRNFPKFWSLLNKMAMEIKPMIDQRPQYLKTVENDTKYVNSFHFMVMQVKAAEENVKHCFGLRFRIENRSNIIEKYNDLFEHMFQVKEDEEKVKHGPQQQLLILHNNQMVDIRAEMRRIHCMFQFYSRNAETNNETLSFLRRNMKNVTKMEQIEEHLNKLGRFDEHEENTFMELLSELDRGLNTRVKVTDVERREITRALGHKVGRWFKCPNGHPYVVTECGGATQVSNCPECGERIGGLNHRLLETNELASEMDGALRPVYPDEPPLAVDEVVQVERVPEGPEEIDLLQLDQVFLVGPRAFFGHADLPRNDYFVWQ